MRCAHLTWGALALLQGTPALAQQIEPEHGPAQVHSHQGAGPHFIDAFYTENAYLERKIRESFDFGATPIKLRVRPRST